MPGLDSLPVVATIACFPLAQELHNAGADNGDKVS
jgi:hypothetical protein